MSAKRQPRPGATKRRSLEASSPLALPARAVEGIRSMLGPVDAAHRSDRATPAGECAEARRGSGLEPPEPAGVTPIHLERSFLFVDVSGFTAYVDRHGEHDALALLTRFRSAVRDVAARRGVRVGKWLGDGVMLVGTRPEVIVAAAAELVCRFTQSGIDIHCGVASGPVLLFEGDDYIGRPVNLAARLCDAATKGEVLAVVEPDELPDWVESRGTVTVHVPGVGDVRGVHQLTVRPDVLATFSGAGAAA